MLYVLPGALPGFSPPYQALFRRSMNKIPHKRGSTVAAFIRRILTSHLFKAMFSFDNIIIFLTRQHSIAVAQATQPLSADAKKGVDGKPHGMISFS